MTAAPHGFSKHPLAPELCKYCNRLRKDAIHSDIAGTKAEVSPPPPEKCVVQFPAMTKGYPTGLVAFVNALLASERWLAPSAIARTSLVFADASSRENREQDLDAIFKSMEKDSLVVSRFDAEPVRRVCFSLVAYAVLQKSSYAGAWFQRLLRSIPNFNELRNMYQHTMFSTKWELHLEPVQLFRVAASEFGSTTKTWPQLLATFTLLLVGSTGTCKDFGTEKPFKVSPNNWNGLFEFIGEVVLSPAGQLWHSKRADVIEAVSFIQSMLELPKVEFWIRCVLGLFDRTLLTLCSEVKEPQAHISAVYNVGEVMQVLTEEVLPAPGFRKEFDLAMKTIMMEPNPSRPADHPVYNEMLRLVTLAPTTPKVKAKVTRKHFDPKSRTEVSSFSPDPEKRAGGAPHPIELRIKEIEKSLQLLSHTVEPTTGSQLGPTERELRDRDRRRIDILNDWATLKTEFEQVPNSESKRLKQLRSRISELQTAMHVQERIIEQFPLPREEIPDGVKANESELWPYQRAMERIKRFKQQFVAPLLTARLILRQRRETIQAQRKLGLEVQPSLESELMELDASVQRLFGDFKPAYDSLMPLLRAGFPELRTRIWEDIDQHCGMGKLRMDVNLADFRCTPLPSTTNVFRAATVEGTQKSKGLKSAYTLKKFTCSDDFYREMEAMRVAENNGVHHPNVGEVEFGIEEGFGDSAVYYLAMPVYQCGSRTWFKRQLEAKDSTAVVRALVEMVEGLACLHHNGVIHGDIKPENLMFDVEQSSGRPKWIDFNFAGVDLKTNALLKVKTAQVGVSHGFTPPEFLDGATASRTPESDVYSLGQTFAALLGMPDPKAEGSIKEAPTDSLGPTSLGLPAWNSIRELFQLMTHRAPERRVSLTKPTDFVGQSVLQRLQEAYNQLTPDDRTGTPSPVAFRGQGNSHRN